jgi:ribonuclease HI
MGVKARRGGGNTVCSRYNREMKNDTIIAYTDGSSLGNPGPGGWGVIVNFVDTRISEAGGREVETTNNRMELMAAIEALWIAEDMKADMEIHTDSSYVRNGITNWVKGWQRNNWKTKAKQDVLNRDLWEKLVEAQERRERFGKVSWYYVEGHVGHPGNERADTIATSFAKKEKVDLYDGDKERYPIDLTVTESVMKKGRKVKSRSKAKAYSYLSLIDGVLEKHDTWAQCEARVKGKSAKFKKAISKEDEQYILKEWGVS